jgi:outer membrane lipoprotein-sorting protein
MKNNFTARFFSVNSLFWLVYMLSITSVSAQSAARHSLDAMLAACTKVQTLTFKMLKTERIDGKTNEAISQIKYRKSPFSAYVYGVEPKKGIEILFNKGQNNNNAYVYPGGFPYVALSLSPYGNVMRGDNHFTIYDIGFETLAINLRHSVSVFGSRFDEFFKLEGAISWKEYSCEKLVLTDTDYKWVSYTVPKAITLEVLARGLHLNTFAIKERNNLSGYGSVKAGTVLQIPTSFAKKVVLYIDKATHLPVYQEIHDDKGKYSSYEFHELKVNAPLTDEDFSKTNKKYNF